ncbi:amidohydrolase family protein [Hymenobacter elongatus]|uniref:Amidohydrolase n=1 Tax=Hymenobacter elongatus TaxID=877208 RepID=A0A4Z0PIG5_9BACT|nr:amidohydrolase [Hymenobacter elongatus]TGE14095.1 amidohydrolase [Hymenobacter elongatus]
MKSVTPALLLFLISLLLSALPDGSQAQPAAARLPRPAAYVRANSPSRSWELRNGHWFDGQRFKDRTVFVRNGLFQRRRPLHVDTVVDLRGQWVVPPFAEAHNHMLDGTAGLPEMIRKYLADGVYYVQVLTNSRSGAEQARPFLNRPQSVDVAYAHGGLTSTLGHPFMAYEPRAMGLYDPSQWATQQNRIARSRLRENDAYWFLDSLPAVAAKWPHIMAGRPDVLKIYLLHAREYDTRPRSGKPGEQGLRPAVAAEIVRRAHAKGLRVYAHIETADDFRLGVQMGVDGFAHAPTYGGNLADTLVSGALTAADLRAAGRRGIVVTPTVWVGSTYFAPADSARLRAFRAFQGRQLRAMVRHGVRPLVGADWWGETPVGEALAWEELGVFDHAMLLRLWSETTAQAIFPGRRIGRLVPGYEASLLGCTDNYLCVRAKFR